MGPPATLRTTENRGRSAWAENSRANGIIDGYLRRSTITPLASRQHRQNSVNVTLYPKRVLSSIPPSVRAARGAG